LEIWLRDAFFAEKKWPNTLITYPFARALMDKSMNLQDASVWKKHQYTSEILKVMSQIHGIFCWEAQQSSLSPECVDALPRWKEEKEYPNVKKILHSWMQGPFPDSFCGNIIFFMQNRARLESFGCDMKFLDDCQNHLPALLDHSRPGALKYREFYRDVFRNQSIYKKKICDFQTNIYECAACPEIAIGDPHQNSLEHIQYYTYIPACLENLQKIVKHPAARWLFGLAEALMTADIILGHLPEGTLSVQGIAAYINDRLEYVQFHPDYRGMNTNTLNACVQMLTRNGMNVYMRIEDQEVRFEEGGVAHPLNQKKHGLRWGVHPFILDQGWWPRHFDQGSKHFLKTKLAIDGLTKFGVSNAAVESLKSSMDAQGQIPIALYYNPLTEDALNAFLQQCGKEPAVFAPALNGAKRTVECILHDMKFLWEVGAEVQYVCYHEFFAYDRVTTRADLAALAETMIVYGDLKLQDPFAAFLLVRAYIEKVVLPNMLEEKRAILFARQQIERLSDQSGQMEYVSELREATEQCYTEFQRKKQILDFFCDKQDLPPGECLLFQHANMLVLFLSALGVVKLPCACTVIEAQDIISEISDGCPLQKDLKLYYKDSKMSLADLSI